MRDGQASSDQSDGRMGDDGAIRHSPRGVSRPLGIVALVVSMVAWGVTFAMNRWMVKATPLADEPWAGLSLGVFRFAVAAPVLAVWATVILRRRWRLVVRDWLPLAALGFLGVVGYHLTANTAQMFASSTLNALLHQMTPAIAFVGGLVLLRERLSAAKILGLVVASAGAVWYSLLAGADPLAGDNIPLAAGLVFLVAVDWTLYLVIAKRALVRWSAVDLTILSNAVGAAMLLIVGQALQLTGRGVTWDVLGRLTLTTWAVLLFLGIVAGVVCYAVYNVGLKAVEGSRAAVFGYLLVPSAMVAGLFLPGDLREEVTLTEVIAAALIVAGIYLVTRERPARS